MRRRQSSDYAGSIVKKNWGLILLAGILGAIALIAVCVFIATHSSNSASPFSSLTSSQQSEAVTKFKNLDINMKYADVVKVMGKPGELKAPPTSNSAHSTVPTLPGNTYVWNFDENGYINIRIYFIPDGTLQMVSFMSMYEPASKVPTSKFEQIKDGMLYPQVVHTLGATGVLSGGMLTRMPGKPIIGQKSEDRAFTTESYDWLTEETSAKKTIRFVDGLVKN
jgi:hypothetical protein